MPQIAKLPRPSCYPSGQPSGGGLQGRALASVDQQFASDDLSHALFQRGDLVVEEVVPSRVMPWMNRVLPT